jgi:hypothetical protein
MVDGTLTNGDLNLFVRAIYVPNHYEMVDGVLVDGDLNLCTRANNDLDHYEMDEVDHQTDSELSISFFYYSFFLTTIKKGFSNYFLFNNYINPIITNMKAKTIEDYRKNYVEMKLLARGQYGNYSF